NRRGGHDQQVWYANVLCGTAAQRYALTHAETMLLVDDDQPQTRKLEFVLDERLGADERVQSTAGGVSVDSRSLFALDAAGEQAQRRPPTQCGLELRPGGLEQSTQCSEVLLGENLRRGHQRALIAIRQRVHQAHRRDGR